MSSENNQNKDIANSLNKYSDYNNKGINAILDSANQINNWYSNEIDKLSETKELSTRLETNVDNDNEKNDLSENISKIETKVNDYTELQTNLVNNLNLKHTGNKIKTQLENNDKLPENIKLIQTKSNKNNSKVEILQKNEDTKLPSKISTAIKGAKILNNTTNTLIKSGKKINTGLTENSIKSFESSTNKIMSKPIKKLSSKASKKVRKKATNSLVKLTKVLAKLTLQFVKMILSMLPSIAPAIFIMIIIICFCSFFGLSMSDDTMKKYEQYMISTQKDFDSITTAAYNSGTIVEGAIEGKGMINWRASMAIIQMLNGELSFDNAEKDLLNEFAKANLYEQIKDVSYTYEKEIEETDKDGNKTTKKKTVTETKKVVSNPSLNDYIDWCNNNFKVINSYKKKKKIEYDKNQTSFTESEVEQIKLLYGSTSFFDLFSEEFKTTYAYSCVNINDEQIQAIYNEFLVNAGTRYLMDHSNLKYDECMDYYDCSSWVIHVLGHTGIKIIPNTGAQGIYMRHCYPISASDRKAGDLIFLKNTYGNFPTEGVDSITHIGIYMGELTINGETAEWVIDTGSNPSGVRIRKYTNGWWNGSQFYGFARLK